MGKIFKMKIRIVIWGRNEYNGMVECHAEVYDTAAPTENFYLKDNKIHLHFKYNPRGSFRFFKDMSRHYVFDLEGKCISHRPKEFLNKANWQNGFKRREGLPYAFFSKYENKAC